MPKKSPLKLAKEHLSVSVGRRKRSSGTATLAAGKGEFVINGFSLEKFFPGAREKSRLTRPLVVTETLGKYDIVLRVSGGGKNGQLDACTLAIARALVEKNPEFRTVLRRNDLLTRDPRKKQRRQIGKGGKSRRKKQSPKR